MATKTQFILLGLLKAKGTLSGYELKKQISGSTAFFWDESYGAIYPTLHKLQEGGLVSSREEEGKRKLILYTITQQGETALQEWLARPAEQQKPRHELLLKIFFSLGSPVEQTREHIESRLLEVEKQLKMLQHIESELEGIHADDPGKPYWKMTLNHGILLSRATVEWCHQCLATLEEQ